MSIVSITAEAGRDICRRIASGELEVAGIQVREAGSKQIRYILRGFETLEADATVLDGLSPLAPLRQAIGITQLLGVVAVAQNAAIALSLRRIEYAIERIEQALADMGQRLASIETELHLIRDWMERAPVSRLKAAIRSGRDAYAAGDRTALRAAAMQADKSAQEILDKAARLVQLPRKDDGLPRALGAATELRDLVESGTKAVAIASAMYLALGNREHAIEIVSDAGRTIETMRRRLHSVLTDPELMLRRLANDRGNDGEIIAAGKALRDALHICRDREMMIRQGLISSDPERVAFERAEPVQDVGFFEIRPVPDTSEPRAS